MYNDERGRTLTDAAASAFPASCALSYFVIPHLQFSRSSQCGERDSPQRTQRRAKVHPDGGERRENDECRVLNDDRSRALTDAAASAFPASCALSYFVIPHS